MSKKRKAAAADGALRVRNYSDLILTSLMHAAKGPATTGTALSAGALAAVEIASGVWSRALSTAAVSPAGARALSGIGPGTLARIGRSLCRYGEFLALIRVSRSGYTTLAPAATWTVQGDSPDPADWRYRLDVPSPDGTRQRDVSADAVVHVRMNESDLQPDKGRSPLALMVSTANAAARIETATAAEFAAVRSEVLSATAESAIGPHGTGATQEQLNQSLRSIAEMLKPINRDDPSVLYIPRELKHSRIGPNPEGQFTELRDGVTRDILMAHGIPPQLWDPRSAGTAGREAYRQLLHATIAPVALLVGHELRLKLHPSTELSLTELHAADIASRARALRSLVDAGIDATEARRIAGV